MDKWKNICVAVPCLWYWHLYYGVNTFILSIFIRGNLAQILIYRVFWSIPLLLAVRLLFRQRTRFHDAGKIKIFFFCMIAGLLMIVSWSSFIYALTHHLVLDASLGYFINPLFVIALGCIFLKKTVVVSGHRRFSGVCGLTFQIIMLRHFRRWR